MLWSIKYKTNLQFCSLLCISLVLILWQPTTNNGCCFGYHCWWRASNCCYWQWDSRNKLISLLVYWFILNPFTLASANPFCIGSWGWSILSQQNQANARANGSIMVGMFVCLCFASQKPSKQELFISTGTNLAVTLLKLLLRISMDSILMCSKPLLYVYYGCKKQFE